MTDTVAVYFNGLSDPIQVSSILAQFSLFGHELTIRWYGAIIAFGFLLAVLFGGRMAYKWKMSLDKMIDVLIYGTIFGIIGARLYYCLFKWEQYKDNPLEILQIWNGGLAIYGGIIGGIAAAYIVCKVRKMNFWNLMDLVGMSLLIGQGIGRWGNFANQEAFGTNTDLPWGMWSSKVATAISRDYAEITAKGIEIDPNHAVHPTFLYESLWCLLGVLVLYIITRKARKFSGQIFLCYGVWYGMERAVVEGFRTDSLYITGTTIRVSQLLSAVLAAVCLVILIALLIKFKKHPKPIDGVDFFLEEELKKQKAEATEREETIETEKESISNSDSEDDKNV